MSVDAGGSHNSLSFATTEDSWTELPDSRPGVSSRRVCT